uniref:Uncharacterized protein AlNc14C539G12097 n=1 Tax=Albugo laibachii Nc14 TaxID=890382 RepID=F0X110_9STRA|nr:PREDICTED: similar to conserved hypothetical protein [Albugo laibachii Nc14]|eukprot:CCA27457.1 PREDICTED: similar to conserved hypothetical protein [Albugo laibachii Nc14]
MVVRRGHYEKQDVVDALERVRNGESYPEVARASSVPLRTLFKKAKDQQSGIPIEGLRRGTKPAISADLESHLVEWIASMQCVGPTSCPHRYHEACHHDLRRAAEAHESQPVDTSHDWMSIGRVRNALGKSSVDVLFNTMAKLLIENTIDSSRVFNMDETSFTPKSTTRTVIAIKGSSNVWTQEIKPSFHMSVVAAVSASGFAVPPLIILPGVRLLKTELAALSIDGARVTGAPKGFSNATILKDWLAIFSTVLEAQGIQKPVILILDNSSTHVYIESVNFCCEHGILMIALPANATHIFQPLDVAVFKPFKTIVRERLQLQMYETADPALSKQIAIEIACYAYRSAIIEQSSNAIEGFRGTGLYPLSLVQLHKRLGEYQAGEVKGDFGNASWLVRHPNVVATVQNAILTVPPEPVRKQKKRRTTIDIAGRLLTKEMLAEASGQ